MKVRFAVSPPANVTDMGDFGVFVEAVEQLGFDTVWLSDIPLGHLVDPIVGLAFAAGRTTRLKLGANIVPFGRNPLIMAKSLAQLDTLSEGRLLLSLVRGLDQPSERGALGVGASDRGRLLEEIVAMLRQWWDGAVVDQDMGSLTFSHVPSPAQPTQRPLELWVGGSGPQALRRAGRIADGWLGGALTPAEAGAARRRIEDAATEAGRSIDPEHFGMSLSCARERHDEASLAILRARRPDANPEDLAPAGADGLRSLIDRYVTEGISKFVIRPVGTTAPFDDELSWLADVVLSLQT